MDHDPVADALVRGARSYIDSILSPVLQRIAALEARSTPAPIPGVGINTAIRSAAGHLVLILTDGRTIDLGKVDGEPGRDGASVDINDLRGIVAMQVASMPPAPPGRDADPATVVEMLRTETGDLIKKWIAEAAAALPPARDGRDVDPADIERMISTEVDRRMALLPAPKDGAAGKDGVDGKDGRDGLDGKGADPAEMQRAIAVEISRQMETAPRPRDGVDGKDGAPGPIGPPGREGPMGPPGPQGDMGPVGEIGVTGRDGADGKDGVPGSTGPAGPQGEMGQTGEMGPAGRDGVDGACGPTGPQGEIGPMGPPGAGARDGAAGRDGISVTDALINREGNLVLTLSDGSTRELGMVIGRDADMDALAAVIVAEVAKMPKPRDGVDGVGFEDLQVIHDGERTVTFRFTRGDVVRDFPVTVPGVIDRGVFKDGAAYAAGDGVTFAGSYWIAQADTSEKPEISRDWRMAVRRGRDGKNTESIKHAQPVKSSGKDGS